MNSITYTLTNCPPVPADMNRFVGTALTGGHPAMNGDVKVVRFAQKVGRQTIALRVDTRPELASLVAAYEAQAATEKAEREARWAAARAEEAAQDAPILAKMEADADTLRAAIPEGDVLVTTTQRGDLDGDPILDYSAEGVRLRGDEVTHRGTAVAIRSGALGAFRSVRVYSISREMLEAARERQKAEKAEKAEKAARETARIEAARAEAERTGVPQVLSCEVVQGKEDFDYLYTEIDGEGRITERREEN